MSTAFEYALLHRGYDVSITSKLGEGGFGIVYAGVRLSDNTPIAVKYVHCTDVWRWHSTKNAGLKIPMEIHMLTRVKDINGTIKLYDWFKLDKGYVLVHQNRVAIQLSKDASTHSTPSVSHIQTIGTNNLRLLDAMRNSSLRFKRRKYFNKQRDHVHQGFRFRFCNRLFQTPTKNVRRYTPVRTTGMASRQNLLSRNDSRLDARSYTVETIVARKPIQVGQRHQVFRKRRCSSIV